MADIETAKDGPVATVTLNRAASRNAMTLVMWREVAATFAALGSDRYIRGIILTGAGGNFSVGADVSEFGRVRGSAAAAADYERAVDACSDAIAGAMKPVIAVVDGYCLGGGCHLALACDFRIAGPTAAMGIPSAKLSIVYGVRSTQRLLALVGLPAAKRILYSAERLGGEEALRIGLADELSAAPMARARGLAVAMADNAPLSIAGAKEILSDLSMGPGMLDLNRADAIIDRAADSYDYREGRVAFAEKRAPRFKGE